MRLGLLLVFFAAVAHAAPPAGSSSDPAWKDAVRLWIAAESAKDPAHWRDAAKAFDAIADDAHLANLERVEAADAAMRAWMNTGPDEDRLIGAATRYLGIAGDAAPDAGLALYARGRMHWGRDRFEQARADLEAVVDHHADAAVAPYAAELLLDLLNRQQKWDDLIARVKSLRANTTLMRDGDLARRLDELLAQIHRKEAEQAEQQHDFAACAAIYRDLIAADPKADRVDELVYDEAICLDKDGEIDGALAVLAQVPPRSSLARHALALTGEIDAQVARFPDAAAAFEDLARRFPDEVEADDALSRAITYRIALGDYARARDDAKLAGKLFGAHDPDLAWRPFVAIALARIANGDRKTAARELIDVAPWVAIEWRDDFALVMWDASCPIEPVDGLCAKPRDPILLRFAKDARAPRVDAAIAVESALAIDRPGPAFDRALRAANAALDALTATDPDTFAWRDRLDDHLALVTGGTRPHVAHELVPRPRMSPW
ncbi:MAG TPA: hypothetical protein VL463_20670 [Kofleriaceae bacterium]|nr:hypothetical protein [Kofleriaceae bacterium]